MDLINRAIDEFRRDRQRELDPQDNQPSKETTSCFYGTTTLSNLTAGHARRPAPDKLSLFRYSFHECTAETLSENKDRKEAEQFLAVPRRYDLRD
jgi:hypothetical protein